MPSLTVLPGVRVGMEQTSDFRQTTVAGPGRVVLPRGPVSILCAYPAGFRAARAVAKWPKKFKQLARIFGRAPLPSRLARCQTR